MKSIAAVALLLMSSVEGYRLVQGVRMLNAKGGVEDIDPDDQELADGLDKESDLAVYQQTFVSQGKNVNKLNEEAERLA